MPEKKLEIEAVAIEQKELHSTRSFDVEIKEGRAEIQFKVEDVAEHPSAKDTFCKIYLRNEADEEVLVVESIIRVTCEVSAEGHDDSFVDDSLSQLALRVAYPYHRSTIGNVVLQSGLPGLLLPLAADPEWVKVVENRKSDEE